MTKGLKAKTWNADEYSKNSSLQYKAAMGLFSNYPFKGDEGILDIGSGDGKITAYLAKKVPNGHVIGTDFSENMVKFARKNHQLPNLTFEQIDAQALNYLHQFDLVVSNFCLHWVPNKQLVFHHISKALKPNAFLLANLTVRNQLTLKIRTTMIQEEHWKEYFKDFIDSSSYADDAGYQDYALNAGLKIIECFFETATEHFEKKALLSNFFRAITPHIDSLPSEDLKNKFMQEYVDRYLEIHGEYSISYNYFKLIAQSSAIKS